MVDGQENILKSTASKLHRTMAETTNDSSIPSSGVTDAHLQSKITDQLNATHVEIIDISGGCGQMFEAVIVSDQFAKKTTLARHRLVNGILKEEIAAIHAWTPKCFTLAEWEKKKKTEKAGN